jgi:hypothetical protein
MRTAQPLSRSIGVLGKTVLAEFEDYENMKIAILEFLNR